jgi:hypothetical protein
VSGAIDKTRLWLHYAVSLVKIGSKLMKLQFFEKLGKTGQNWAITQF